MEPIKIMVNGMPGNVAVMIGKSVMDDSRFKLIPYSLTGPEITAKAHKIKETSISLVQPDDKDREISYIIKENSPFICVDYTHPSAVNENAMFYCKHELPFVMGTTGGDRLKLLDTVKASTISAVISPNMAKQIVGFQAMMSHAADNFPDLFKGFSLTIKESHQKGKADTSGTAKAQVSYFNRLGIPFVDEDIEKERDPEIQKNTWHIPEAYLDAHGWHTYTLISKDKNVKFEFTHNVNGRMVYVEGTLDAVFYLKKKLNLGVKGEIFSMIDVLKELG